jgi:hypothetical protein
MSDYMLVAKPKTGEGAGKELRLVTLVSTGELTLTSKIPGQRWPNGTWATPEEARAAFNQLFQKLKGNRPDIRSFSVRVIPA